MKSERHGKREESSVTPKRKFRAGTRRRKNGQADPNSRVGKLGKGFPNPVQSKYEVSQETMNEIAKEFFVDYLSTQDIGKRHGISEERISWITRGQSHSVSWSRSVLVLIAGGIECGRSPFREADGTKKKRTKPNRGKLKEGMVRSIRYMSNNHESAELISESTNVPYQTVVSILREQTYRGSQYFPPTEGE